MKKLLIVTAVFIGIMAGAVALSSFTELKQECVQNGMNTPTYWDGIACCGRCDYNLHIKVYQTEGMCNSFYAVVVGGYQGGGSAQVGEELWVKENPFYDENKSSCCFRKYLVTYGDYNYYFNM